MEEWASRASSNISLLMLGKWASPHSSSSIYGYMKVMWQSCDGHVIDNRSTFEAVFPERSSLPIFPISSRSFSLYRSEADSQLCGRHRAK